jgi:membrane associated rhomboid family serine protease
MKILKRIDYNAPVVLSFALLSFFVLLLGEATGGTITFKYFCVYRSSFADPLTYFRLFSHVLGHANLQHYTSNMLLLLILGPMLEEKYGSKIILEMIIVTAFVTGVINFIFFTNGLLGASGIVFMMIILSSMVSLKEGKIPLTLIIVVIIYLGQEISIGLTTKDNISHLTHILGGVCGGVMGAMVFNKKKLV